MKENEKIECLKNKLEIKNKLNKLGICGLVGPTGPREKAGTNINIRGSFNSLEELINTHPKGNMGDTYLINGNLYYWNDDIMIWENAGHIEGYKRSWAYGERYSRSRQTFSLTANRETIILK